MIKIICKISISNTETVRSTKILVCAIIMQKHNKFNRTKRPTIHMNDQSDEKKYDVHGFLMTYTPHLSQLGKHDDDGGIMLP